MNANFFEGSPDPMADPRGFFQQQNMANQLRKQGATVPQGAMAGGQYVPPAPTAYAQQLASALAGGYKQDQIRGASRASDILNGGAGADPSKLGQLGGWLGGMFQGGA